MIPDAQIIKLNSIYISDIMKCECCPVLGCQLLSIFNFDLQVAESKTPKIATAVFDNYYYVFMQKFKGVLLFIFS